MGFHLILISDVEEKMGEPARILYPSRSPKRVNGFAAYRKEKSLNNNNNNNNNDNNSIRVYLRANLTAQRPITKLARVYRNTQK
jgi:hypothetical protein